MLSFVVPAYNEEKYLPATLAAIHSAARECAEPYEVVVANDKSADATAAIAAQGGAKVIDVEKRQIAGTRNAGARAASGDMLIFVDADTLVNAAVVSEALAAMRAGAVGGGAPVRFDRPHFWVTALMFVVLPLFRWAKWAAGCFVFCTREAFERTGGFDEQYFASEEIHFSQALKRQGRFVVVRSFVVSSARKLDSHGFWKSLWLFVRIALRGPGGLRRHNALTSFWYPDKR
ncbi:MAG TPA: glycosyltransferase [Usitatibacter sp.]|nr:glycosyltransferase [Usitatibacter sp.]